ncbi:MAG: hypothetical protein ACI4TW_08655 [Prevotella sp.]
MKNKHFRRLLSALLLVASMVMPSTAWAENTITPSKPDGAGTGDNPYKITSAAELYWFAGLVNGTLTDTDQNKAACVTLMDNIVVNEEVLDASGNLNSHKDFIAWKPIGTSEINIYTGTFDGNGYTVGGLYFDNENTDNVGLFGCNGGTIKNLGVVDSYFKGQCYVGGVCGYNLAISTSGTVTATIMNCYNTSTVCGSVYIGGMCGYNSTISTSGTAEAIITNCYNTGIVSGGESAIGSVCGDNYAFAPSGIAKAIITNCYYFSDTAIGGINGADVPGSAEGKTIAQFKSGEVAWLLNGSTAQGSLAWYQNIDGESEADTFPVLNSNGHGIVYRSTLCERRFSNTENNSLGHDYENGFCKFCDTYEPATQNGDVYEISNAGQLYWFAGLVYGMLSDVSQNTGACVKLTQNIIVNSGVVNSEGSLADDVSGFRNWTPIGNSTNEYTGTFDGDNHSISGLYFNNESTEFVGLFGVNGGTIKNVGVIDSYFNASYYVGSVCGQNNGGTITNCYNTGIVSGEYTIGGVCGENGSSGTIKCCYNTGTVSGGYIIGGVCGNNQGTIANCHYLSGKAAGGINGADMPGSAEGKTTDEFNSGSVCYLLNGSSPYGEWGQQIGTDDYPVLGSDYKVLMAAQDGLEGTTYWATFSNLDSNAELMVAEGKNITVYNAIVSNGTLTLTKRDDNKVAAGEGVLLKANSEYMNAKNISEDVSADAGANNLVATPKTAQTITAASGYTLYRLTYDQTSTKEGLGFYLGKVGESDDGSQLKATPGKAYLNVLTTDATETATAKLARGFAFGGDDEITGIKCITVTDGSSCGKAVNGNGIFDLTGRKVINPAKGLYIMNGKKVIIK